MLGREVSSREIQTDKGQAQGFLDSVKSPPEVEDHRFVVAISCKVMVPYMDVVPAWTFNLGESGWALNPDWNSARWV